MAALQRFGAILLADLRERTRSTRFWTMLVLMTVVIWWCFPTPEEGYLILSMPGGVRGAYSSAWVGLVLAMAYSILLGLGGFYLVRGTLARDFDTRVWQLLVSTPMTRSGYLLAKWASHMLVLMLIAGVGMLVGLVAQWVRAEDRSIDLIELVKPTLLLAVPGMAVTAMFAIWFDLLPWLRRTAGNVLFFFVWVFLIAGSVSQFESKDHDALRANWRSDPNGLAVVAREFNRVRMQQTGKDAGFGFNIGTNRPKSGVKLIQWTSIEPRPLDLFGRLLWLLASIGAVAAAAPLLDWAAARTSAKARARNEGGSRLRWLDRALAPFARHPLTLLASAELKLALRQRRWWWWLLALVAFGLQAFASDKGLGIGLLIAWMLPLDLLARSILRESEHGTGGLMYTASGIVGRLLASRFLSGFALLLGLTAVGVLRLASAEPSAALACVVISASIVSWGLCLGAIFRNPRPFELAMTALAYIAVQGAAVFDVFEQPLLTAQWHALLLIPAWFALGFSWPRLARV